MTDMTFVDAYYDDFFINLARGTGTLHQPQALLADFVGQIQADCDRISWTLQENDDNPWLRYLDAKIPDDTNSFPAITLLRRSLESHVASFTRHFPALASWHANDVTAQCYRDENDGIDTHQDYSVDELLIVIVTVRGKGPLQILSARHGGEVMKTHQTGPGDLTFMRAPGLYPSEDDIRPPHRILRPQDGRISVTFRYTTGETKFRNERSRG